MTSFDQKFNLLSLLRGYDLFDKNYLNTSLLGYGKHHHHHRKKLDAETRYLKFVGEVLDKESSPLTKYFIFFKFNPDFEEKYKKKEIIQKLCAFTRYYIASRSPESSDFLTNLEQFTKDMLKSARYLTLLNVMDKWGDETKEAEDDDYLPEGFIQLKKDTKKSIVDIANHCLTTTNYIDLDYKQILNFVFDCIINLCRTPEDFEHLFRKYMDTIAQSYDMDTEKLFSEDLLKTSAKDRDELEKSDDEDDEVTQEDIDFVVPDDFIEYEERPEKRKRKNDEIEGSGFYDWWGWK